MSMERGKSLEPCPAGAEELAEINRFARTPLTAEEVYCFAVRLCDNEDASSISLTAFPFI